MPHVTNFKRNFLMFKPLRTVAIILSATVLYACGGGSSGDSGFEPPTPPPPAGPVTIEVSADKSTIAANPFGQVGPDGTVFVAEILAEVRNEDGTLVSDGLTVTFTVSPSGRGTLTDRSDLTIQGAQIQAFTAGGQARVLLHSKENLGNVSVQASVDDPNGNGSVSGSVDLQIVTGPAPDSQVSFSFDRTSIQANTNDVPPQLGAPFLASVTVDLVDATGDPVPENTDVNFQISPANLAQVSLVNNLQELSDEITVQSSGGAAQAIIHAGSQTGLIEVRVGFTDPILGHTALGTATLTITQGPQPVQQVVFSLDSTFIQANVNDVPPQLGSPYLAAVNAELYDKTGAPLPEGTDVNFQVFPATRAQLSSALDLTTLNDSVTIVSTGGAAQVIVHALDQPGPVEIRAGFVDPVDGNTKTASTTLRVIPSGDPLDRLTIAALRTDLPANNFGVGVFLGSPYITEAVITFTDQEGNLLQPANSSVGVSINPVSFGAFSTLDDPETDDVNEIEVLLGQGPVDTVAGKATIFIHSFDLVGTTTIVATAQDPVTLETFQAELDINIVDVAANGLPADIVVQDELTLVYTQSSGGNTTKLYETIVFDGGGELIPDPETNQGGGNEWHNVHLELLPEVQGGGEYISATDRLGNPIEGDQINISTRNGVASFTLHSGSIDNLIRLQITADKADNNVSNGIDDPLVATETVVISDGVPFSVEITSPNINGILVNSVTGTVTTDLPDTYPQSPDGTYSIRVSALVTDRRGNPALPNTAVEFGVIDDYITGFPETGPGTFFHAGNDGNPVEGSDIFRAPDSGRFTLNPALGPNDTLILFGEDAPGNEDLESARTIESITDSVSLRVTSPFNPNDRSGSSVNLGPVVPYVAGNAADVNISSESQASTVARTNGVGVASTTLNYPVGKLGKNTVLYAQTLGEELPNEVLRTVADAEAFPLPGVGPATITLAPNTLPGNYSANVLVCLTDGGGAPIQGQFIGFAYDGQEGVARVDGQQDSGVLTNPTDENGCVTAFVETTSSEPDSPDFFLDFFLGGATAELTILTGEDGVLQTLPTTVIGNTSGTEVLLRLLSAAGNPIPGVQLRVECNFLDGIIDVVEQPGVTDENGETTMRIFADLDGGPFGEPIGSGECLVTTPDRVPSAIVRFVGFDRCLLNASPAIPGCDGFTTYNLTIEHYASNNISITPAGVQCAAPAGVPPNVCVFPFAEGTNLTVVHSPGNTPPPDLIDFVCSNGQMAQGVQGFPINIAGSDISCAVCDSNAPNPLVCSLAP